MTLPRPRHSAPLAVLGLCAATVTLLLVARPGANAAGIAEHDYVGAERCRSCHAEAYDKWAKGPHAQALTSLSKHERKDPRCQQCHTMVPEDPDPALGAVQCETCHGPGKYYAPEHVMRDEELRVKLFLETPDESTCARCHTDSSPSIIPWDYRTKLEKIRHWPITEPTPDE